MATIYTDQDTKIKHIRLNGEYTLCGIMSGWTRPNDNPVQEKWGCTCEGCQDQIEELKKVKK